jgi:hypothetical protein
VDHDHGGRHREDPLVGLRRGDVFLLDELDAVTDELEPPVEPARVHRTEPALHVAHHLEQEHVAEHERRERHDHQDDDRLDRERGAPADLERERKRVDRHQRSMSPRMK